MNKSHTSLDQLNMKTIALYCFTLILMATHNGLTQDYLYDLKKKDRDRATYWKSKGYNFDYKCMSAAKMDQKVKDHQRAGFWKLRGFQFDYKQMSASEMDKSALSRKTRKTYPISSKASGSLLKYRALTQTPALSKYDPVKKPVYRHHEPSAYKSPRYSYGQSNLTRSKKNTTYGTHKYSNGDSTTRASDGTTYNTYRYSNGDSVTRGSDGSTYNTYRYSNGDSVTRGSDGTTYNTYKYSNGDSTTRASDGTTYNTYRYSNGDSVTRGSDGSTYNTYRYSNGDSVTRGSNGSLFNSYGK